MFKERKTLILVCWGLLVLSFIGLGCNSKIPQLLTEQEMNPISATIANRTISQNFEDSFVWRKNNINIRRNTYPSSKLLADDGHVAYVDFEGGPLSLINQLQVLEAST